MSPYVPLRFFPPLAPLASLPALLDVQRARNLRADALVSQPRGIGERCALVENLRVKG